MSYTQLTGGSAGGGDYQEGDNWTPTIATEVRDNFDDHEARIGAAVNLATGVTGDLPLSNLAQASAASKLLGRGSASGAGDYQEISLGSGLSMSGTTLSGSSLSPGGSSGNLQTNNGSGGLGAYAGASATPGSYVTAISASGATTVSAIGISNVIVKGADETVSSSTYQADDALAFSIGANETWVADWIIHYDAAAADDMKIAFSGPSGASQYTSVIALSTGSVSFSADVLMASMVSLADDGYTVGGAGSGTVVSCVLTMTVVNSSNAGTVTFRWARAAGSGNVIVKAKSFVRAIRVS